MKLENNLDYVNDLLITKRIIEKYKNHPSIKALQDTFPVKKESKIEEAKVQQVNKILRNTNSGKITRPDKIPLKIVKMIANTIDLRIRNRKQCVKINNICSHFLKLLSGVRRLRSLAVEIFKTLN